VLRGGHPESVDSAPRARDRDIIEDSLTRLQPITVRDGERKFLTALDLKLLILECRLDDSSNLLYRDRKWVLDSECQAPGYSGPVRAGMPSNRSILAYLTAVVARQRFVSSLTRQYTSTSTIAVHLVSIKTLLLDSEPLRTSIIHKIHSLRALGHLGRNLTYQAVAREYF
jgi:hypothetical protein